MTIKEILKKYDSQLLEYANIAFPKLKKYIEKEKSPYKNIIKKLFDFYLLTSFLLDEKIEITKKENNPIFILYNKACLSLLGIVKCLENGLSSEAAILLRNLFENYVYIKLIFEKDTEERLKLYYNYQTVNQWNNIQTNLNLLKNGKLDLNDFQKSFSLNLIRVCPCIIQFMNYQ